MYETEYLSTTEMWAGDVDITIYHDFRRTFRVTCELFQDIVEAAYDSVIFHDDRPGRKNKKRICSFICNLYYSTSATMACC
jgi:hypothetical protein